MIDFENYGRFVLFLSVIHFFSFLSLPGLNISIKKGVLKKYDKVYHEAIKVNLKFVSPIFIATILVYMLQVSFSQHVAFLSDSLKQYLPSVDWKIITLAFVFTFPSIFAKHESFLLAKEKYSLVKNIKVFEVSTKILIVCGVAYLFKDINYILFSYIFHMVILTIIGNYFVLKNMLSKNGDINNSKQIVNEGKKYNIIELIGTIGRLDKVILGTIDPSLLAVFHIGQRFPRLIKDNMKIFITPFIMTWGKLSREEHLSKLRKNFFNFFFIGILIFAISGIVSAVFIPLIFGSNYEKSILISLLLSLIIISKPLSAMILDFDTVQDKGINYTYLMSFLPVLYIFLIFFLIPKYDVMGIVSSQIIVNIFANIAIAIFIFKGGYLKKCEQ
tara:strand:- start:1877 stop:3037 length:1161 start_codon:yes stop_codon:yes gene_type:complete